jgi:PadR family transcriptional regulator PadR
MNEEQTELIDEQVYSWLEVHKKSALSYVILSALSKREMWSQELTEWIIDKTGWSVTEKGLYRLLRRMQQADTIDFRQITAKRTGAKRNVFFITPNGKLVLSKIVEQLKYLYGV